MTGPDPVPGGPVTGCPVTGGPVTGGVAAPAAAPAAAGDQPAAGRPWRRELAVLAVFLAAGVAATWPQVTGVSGRLPRSGDVTSYVWGLWWVAHQLSHLGNPWYTGQLAAPAGTQLGFDTLMPLLGALMTPVTLVFGPAVSFSLLTAAVPGLACYTMYRAARLWLPGLTGPVAAGAGYGLSAMLAFQDWSRLHVAAGMVFLPLTLETAVRFRRGPTARRGAALGLVLGGSVLVAQESAVLAVALAALVLVPWLAAACWRGRGRALGQVRALAAGAAVAAAVASPQLIAMLAQLRAGGATAPPADLASSYRRYVAELPALFAPSPRLASVGLRGLAAVYRHYDYPLARGDSLVTYGVVLTVAALAGLAVSWRRRSAWQLAALWLGSAALALGPTLHIGARQYVPLAQQWHGLRVSPLLPYTWLVRVPGLSGLREADRLALLGLVGAALLAGAAAHWLRRHAWPLLIVAGLAAALEAGWSGIPGSPALPTAMPALDRPLAAGHSGSIVVDVPFGLRGGLPLYGLHLPDAALLLATADGHPRAESYTSWEPAPTIARIRRHPFYARLNAAQHGWPSTQAQLAAARADRQRMRIGWVLVWSRMPGTLTSYLSATGFHFAYQADGVRVYRPAGR
ncbi:MAG: hypothetical protein ACM32E_12205 [Gemmatimonadota bacterium]